MRNLLLSLVLSAAAVSASGQEKTRYTDARELQIVGKGLPTDPVYRRLDTVQTRLLTQPVKYLATNSAGIAVLFETNSPYIRARWKMAKRAWHANITPIAHSGLDLYGMINGKWQFAGTARPTDKDTVYEQAIISNMDNTTKQFMVYLPTYNELTSLEIGVQDQAILRRPAKPGIDSSKRVVVYGSSILQGASATRAGMTYTSILQRRTGWDFINLGFSGNGRMEIEVAQLMVTMPASVFVLDCIPNPSLQQVKERAYPFVKEILTKRPGVPVLMVEKIIYENGYFDQQIDKLTKDKNTEWKATFERLKKEGFKNLYYLPADNLIGHDHDGTIDGVHLSDLGFLRQADAMQPVLQQLMKKSVQGK